MDNVYARHLKIKNVAPFTGAWIEILGDSLQQFAGLVVAPFTGAWIEINGFAEIPD